MKNFDVLSIDINCDYKQAFDYIADAENLPKWTNQFKDVSGSRASFDTFSGIVDITFETHASETHGTVDWKLTFPDGNFGWAYSRLTRNIEGVIFAFNFVLPHMAEDELEKARLAQKANIENELANAKAALEAHHE